MVKLLEVLKCESFLENFHMVSTLVLDALQQHKLVWLLPRSSI